MSCRLYSPTARQVSSSLGFALLNSLQAYGRALLEEFSPIVEELSPRRSDEVNAASEACTYDISFSSPINSRRLVVESLDNDRNMLRRRVFLETKEYLEQSLQEYEVLYSPCSVLALIDQ